LGISIPDIFAELSLVSDIKILEPNEYPEYLSTEFQAVVEGKVKILDKTINLNIAFDKYFPYHLPLYFLKPYNQLGLLPHISKSGFVCYMKEEGLLLDVSSPLQIVEESLLKVIKLLIDGANGINDYDFLTEFETYLPYYDNSAYINSILELSDAVKKIKMVKAKYHPVWFAGDNPNDIINFAYKYIGSLRNKKPIFIDGIYIPLRLNTILKPPAFDDFWTTREIRQLIFNNITDSNKKILKSLIKQRIKGEFFIIISVPQANDSKTLFGLFFSDFSPINRKSGRRNQRYSNPLYKADSFYKIRPLSIQRFDKAFIIPRGGGNIDLSKKKVAIIGCGSVGGNIAIELARSGITNIELIDPDELTVENIYRHTLGINSLIKHTYKSDLSSDEFVNAKVLALKEEIEDKLPYTQITAPSYNVNIIESLIENNKIDFKKFDLVIVAIGNPTIELYINDHFHKLKDMPPLIFTWVEAYGIGGHAILTNNKENDGCLKCLYIDPFNDNKPVTSRASFAAPNQIFTKSVSGCGSLFTPYSSLDSVQTAIIATRLALDVLSGQEEGNPIISWKGRADLFLDNGFILSEHYNISNDQLFESRYKYKVASCPVCGMFREE